MTNSLALLVLVTMLALLSSARSSTPLSGALYRHFPAFVAPFSGSSRQRWIDTVTTRTRTPHIHPIATTTNKKLSSSLPAAPQEGDLVRVALKSKSTIQGVVKEVRGSGWYAVHVSSTNVFLKVRGNQLSLVESGPSIASNETTTTTQNDPITMPAPPTIVDIDVALRSMDADTIQNKRQLQYLHQCAHHASVEKWVVFTDLHCSPSSLDTCLAILDKVHHEALERNAGVLFLGDFWHHRATIRIDVLNAVLESLREWQVPMILIPGNHDQVTLGGHNHGLTPLENAYRVEYQDCDGKTQSVPGPLVLTHPTKFRNALFVPHIRNGTIMESVLRSESALNSTALFVHADVTGAYMNDLIVSQGGVSPSWFPPSTLIYSGHFHKPHQVTSGNVCIEYIGSPYETSLAEAGQQKSLVVLNASNWSCVERIPLCIGRKHFSAASLGELLALNVVAGNPIGASIKSGDRVVVTIQKDDLEEMRLAGDVRFDNQIKAIRQLGAVVEVREIAPRAVGPLKPMFEEMTPQTTLSAYFQEQVRRESIKKTMAEQLLKAGLLLLEDLEVEQESTMTNPLGAMTDLTLESVTLQGFGPFKHKVSYPLNNRGLVLVRGINKDGGADSNGSGKSSLAMATLWALTGALDPRPMQDAKVADVVNDESKSARVSVRGTLNGESFCITRTKTSSKGALVFELDEKDLTTQSIMDTQAVIDEKLGVGSQIVARAMFHGQHSMNGLLEATDAKLKEELSLVVPLALWQQGAWLARTKSREASKKAAEFGGMISLRSSDLGESIQRRDEAKANAIAQQASFERMELLLKKEIRELRESTGSPDVDIQDVQNSLETASFTVQELELQLNTLLADREGNLAQLQAHCDESTMYVSLKRDELESKRREHDRALLKVESVQSTRKELEKKWNLDISNGVADLVPPDVCPTCQQPISDSGEGHSHEDLQRIVQDEVNDVVQHLFAAQVAVQKATNARESAAADFNVEEMLLQESHVALQEVRSLWADKIKSVEKDLAKARNEQSAQSTQLSNAAMAMQQESIIKTKEAALSNAQRAAEACASVRDNICRAVEEAEVRLQELQTSGEAQRNLSVQMTNLADAFGARGVQTFVLQNAIEALQTISKTYLDELSDGSQRLELSLDTGDRISRKAMVRSPDGGFVERPLSSLSGGQWRRCSLALSLGFADLVARRGRFKTSLCVLDEPLTHLDRSGRISVGNLLRSLLRQGDSGGLSHSISVSTILIILQDLAAEELEESFDHIDEVTKEDGLSFVSIDEQS